MNFSEYTLLSAAETVARFGSDASDGLSAGEAARRLVSDGPNEIDAQPVRAGRIFARQWRSPFIYLLLGAGGLSFAFGERFDALFILFFVGVNAALGFFQEFRSEKTLMLLKRFVVSHARVRRGGREMMAPSREIVTGDVVLVETGDIIPADLRVLEENNFTVDESTLSGESAPVKKTSGILGAATSEIHQAANLAFAGTTVVGGKAAGIVIAAGRSSVFGEIGKMSVETPRASGFEQSISKFSSFILRLILLTAIFVFFANLAIKGRTANLAELIIFSIALTVSLVPEALPVVTTFSLSRGALRLAKRKVVVKRLSAIEDLGSIDVLCTDKTGTLTENKLAVSGIFKCGQIDPLAAAAAAAPFPAGRGAVEPFDAAIWDRLAEADRAGLSGREILSEIPFDPERRRASALVRQGGTCAIIVRGAPESIIGQCVDEPDRNRIGQWIADEGRLGHRVMAVARKEFPPADRYDSAEEERGLSMVGLVSFVDPLKKSARQAVRKAEALGVRVKILTGDGPEVAGAVGREVGLISSADDVITGEAFERLASDEQHEAVRRFDVFARVSPRQKFRIIQLLREKSLVGFLGEGINDAPALKVAHVALVVHGAADIARESADIVLLQRSLKVIVDGIQEGREVFANTLKYIKATLSSNYGNFYAISIASLLIEPLPMLPLQILLVNLLTDFPLIAVATDRVDPDELRKPKGYQIKSIALLAFVLGLVSMVFDFIFFGLFYREPAPVLQTNWFLGSVMTELVFIFSVRTKSFFLRAKAPSGILAAFSILAFAAAISAPFIPFTRRIFKFVQPSASHLLLILFVVAVYFVMTETVKLLYVRSTNHAKAASAEAASG